MRNSFFSNYVRVSVAGHLRPANKREPNMRLQFGIQIRHVLPLLLILGALFPFSASAQSYINQTLVASILENQNAPLDSIPEVYYDFFALYSNSGNNVIARNNFYKVIGQGDIELGKRYARLVEMLNRRLMKDVFIGDTLVVPTRFDLDFRAYSPFPRYYTGGREFDKLFILDKSVQAFAAYEYGKLMRWGIINTGNPEETPTPNGRFNFNWREEQRVSTLSPPGEEWEMFWVVNFHQARGIHVHQYEMPTGGPTSHGCVRLVDADAEWIYNWADLWKTTVKSEGIGSGAGRILEQGSTVIVIGTEPTDSPQPFEFKKRYPILKRVTLPAHPYDIPPGTPQQEHFDKKRLASKAD